MKGAITIITLHSQYSFRAFSTYLKSNHIHSWSGRSTNVFTVTVHRRSDKLWEIEACMYLLIQQGTLHRRCHLVAQFTILKPPGTELINASILEFD